MPVLLTFVDVVPAQWHGKVDIGSVMLAINNTMVLGCRRDHIRALLSDAGTAVRFKFARGHNILRNLQDTSSWMKAAEGAEAELQQSKTPPVAPRATKAPQLREEAGAGAKAREDAERAGAGAEIEAENVDKRTRFKVRDLVMWPSPGRANQPPAPTLASKAEAGDDDTDNAPLLQQSTASAGASTPSPTRAKPPQKLPGHSRVSTFLSMSWSPFRSKRRGNARQPQQECAEPEGEVTARRKLMPDKTDSRAARQTPQRKLALQQGGSSIWQAPTPPGRGVPKVERAMWTPSPPRSDATSAYSLGFPAPSPAQGRVPASRGMARKGRAAPATGGASARAPKQKRKSAQPRPSRTSLLRASAADAKKLGEQCGATPGRPAAKAGKPGWNSCTRLDSPLAFYAEHCNPEGPAALQSPRFAAAANAPPQTSRSRPSKPTRRAVQQNAHRAPVVRRRAPHAPAEPEWHGDPKMELNLYRDMSLFTGCGLEEDGTYADEREWRAEHGVDDLDSQGYTDVIADSERDSMRPNECWGTIDHHFKPNSGNFRSL